MGEVTDANLLSDSTIFFRDLLANNLTDPISRSGNEKLVVTAFPDRPVKYPVVIVQCNGFESRELGMSTTGHMANLTFECEVVSQSVRQRDVLSQEIFNDLRTNRALINASGLYDVEIRTMVNVDEPANGDTAGLHRKIITWTTNHPTST